MSPAAEASASPTPSPPPAQAPDSEASPDATDPDQPPDVDPLDRSELLVQPEEMEKADSAGAVAAAKYFMGLFEYVFLTGDLEVWDEMSDSECEFCQVVSANARAMHDAGNHQVSEPPRWIGKADVDREVTLPRWHVTLRAEVSGTTTYNADGDIVDEQSGARNRVMLAMHHTGDGWRTVHVAVSDDK